MSRKEHDKDDGGGPLADPSPEHRLCGDGLAVPHSRRVHEGLDARTLRCSSPSRRRYSRRTQSSRTPSRQGTSTLGRSGARPRASSNASWNWSRDSDWEGVRRAILEARRRGTGRDKKGRAMIMEIYSAAAKGGLGASSLPALANVHRLSTSASIFTGPSFLDVRYPVDDGAPHHHRVSPCVEDGPYVLGGRDAEPDSDRDLAWRTSSRTGSARRCSLARPTSRR